MPLTLRRYQHRAIAYGLMLLLLVAVMIYVILTEEEPPVVVFVVFILMSSTLALYPLHKFITLRRAFANASSQRGTIVRYERGIWQGTARIVIAFEGKEYRTPAIFHKAEVPEWVDSDVEFAFGRDGYVFVFRVKNNLC